MLKKLKFDTGHRQTLDEVRELAIPQQRARFDLIENDIRDRDEACEAIDQGPHQTALVSTQRSLADPITAKAVNISDFLNVMVAAGDAKVKSIDASTSLAVPSVAVDGESARA